MVAPAPSPLLFFSPLLSRAPKYAPAARAPAACGLARLAFSKAWLESTRRRGDELADRR